MEMESSRRPPFDRSREQLNSIKKPRLSIEDPRTRPQPQPQPPVINSGSARYRPNSNSVNNVSEGGALQQYQQYQELVNQYKTALTELTFNSKPIITNLTIIAGENLQAARAIAGTICSNILEVPSEQKLPSLYLLDSIVKNIGRDYIKYFAARLPEVFCKAYRHVDPATHPNMRHLFGTWKGVFPPHQLQSIERELGFSASVNGPLSGSNASKTDSQSQRQSNSIHVNPKYLEARNHLQQASRPKVADFDGDLESSEVVERPDRTATSGIERLWADPSVKNIQHPQKETTFQKQGSVGYGEMVSQGLKRPISLSAGKPIGQGYEKRWLGSSEEVEELPSMQRNGFDVKRGISNYAGSRSASSNVPLLKNPPRNNVELSKSWKNSEEEEYMWDDLGVGATDPGAVEKLEFSSHPANWQSQAEVRSNFDRELSADPFSSEPKEHALLPHPRSTSPLLRPGANRVIGGPSSVGISSFGAPTATVSGSTSAAGQRYPSTGQSVMHQRSPSPSISKRDPRQSLLEKNFMKSQTLTRSDPRTASVSISQSSIPSRQDNSLPGNVSVQKSSSDVVPALQQKLYVPSEKLSNAETELSGIVQKAQQVLASSSLKGEVPSDSLNPLLGDLRGQPSVTNLLAAVMKSGLLSGSVSEQVGIQSPPSNSVSSKRAVSPAPHDSASLSVSQIKGERVHLPSGPSASSSAIPTTLPQFSSKESTDKNPLSILSTLISKGLISAPKTEETCPSPSQCEIKRLEQTPKVAAGTRVTVPPVSNSSVALAASTKDKITSSEPSGEGPDLSVQGRKSGVTNLIGLDFRPPVIREFHPVVIDRLSEDLPHRCTDCGLRFKVQETLDRHLEWHGFKNSIPNCLNRPSRRWYSNTASWVDGRVGFPFGYGSTSLPEGSSRTVEDNEESVPADESQCVCLLCGELFDEFYSQERDEWMFKGAVYLPILSGSSDSGPSGESGTQNMIVHANCMSEEAVRDLGLFSGIKMEKTT